VPFTEAIVDLARAGMGIAIVTEWVVEPHLARGGCVAKSLAERRLERPWSFGWRRELGEAGPKLHAILQNAA
jgi:LysR family transcriptional regulator for metE and metH